MSQTTHIVFMGTPDFSVPPLRALATREDICIDLVVTQPDRPKGRGKKLAFSPVKEAAIELGIPVFQPEKLNTDQGFETLSQLNPDYFVVVAFGQILSQRILDIPKKYPINIHASLLPKYRGASPIQAAVLNRDKEAGVTTMVMAKAMDAGDILLMDSTPLDPDHTASQLHDRLSDMGGRLIVETLDQINAGTLPPTPQDHDQATYVGMLKKKDGRIDWNRTPDHIRAHINAMTPWPGAFTQLDGKRLKIFNVIPDPTPRTDTPGTIFACDEKGIHVAVEDGSVCITSLMGSSGKRMAADAFLRGHQITPPSRFE